MNEIKNCCPNCGSRYNTEIENASLFYSNKRDVIKLYACVSCGTVYIDKEDRGRILKDIMPKEAFWED